MERRRWGQLTCRRRRQFPPVHDVAAQLEYVSVVKSMDPVAGAGAACMQSELVDPATLPVMHAWQSAAAATSEYLPEGHCMQTATSAVVVPAGPYFPNNSE